MQKILWESGLFWLIVTGGGILLIACGFFCWWGICKNAKTKDQMEREKNIGRQD